MADERYEWLDGNAAEHLLRGVPVEAADEHARLEAARLLAALESAAEPAYRLDDGELPGEAAALAAFRKTRADGAAPAGDSLGTVTVTRPAPGVRRVRFGGPLRFGLAAALAGCALGGVAVAAGTGVLPSPFRGDDHPLPASSISAAATPDPLSSRSPDGEAGSGVTTPPEAVTTSPAPPPDTRRPDEETPRPGATTPPEREDDRDRATPSAPGTGPDQGADRWRKAVEACQDYRSGRLAPERKQRLEDWAKGPERIKRFCDRLLTSGSTGSGGGFGSGGNSGGGDGGSGDWDGDDGRDDDKGRDEDGRGDSGDAGRAGGLPGLPQVSLPQVSLPQTAPAPLPQAALSPMTLSQASDLRLLPV
ncbi:hypothetical protein [Streptomyces sp. NPDC005805]|uniref:hypothetical protein n=1 Tax=Streptomyces sp. NPDC005805 TaxID=3157068 RepID=UPI0033FA5B89